MTNEQLAILRMTDRQSLAAAIESARNELVYLDSPPLRQRQHRGPIGCITLMPCPDDHYAATGEFLALVPFVELLETFDQQIALLEPGGKKK